MGSADDWYDGVAEGIGALKGKDYELVAKDINGVVRMAHASGALVKVIIETALLSDEEKEIASLLSKEAGAACSVGLRSGLRIFPPIAANANACREISRNLSNV